MIRPVVKGWGRVVVFHPGPGVFMESKYEWYINAHIEERRSLLTISNRSKFLLTALHTFDNNFSSRVVTKLSCKIPSCSPTKAAPTLLRDILSLRNRENTNFSFFTCVQMIILSIKTIGIRYLASCWKYLYFFHLRNRHFVDAAHAPR